MFILLIVICWCAALIQAVASKTRREQSVPAFQNETLKGEDVQNAYLNLSASDVFQSKQSQTIELNVPDPLTKASAASYCQTLIHSLDSSSYSVSSGSSAKYSDFYYYSPFLAQHLSVAPAASGQSNLQIAFTWKNDGTCSHIYLGVPFIEYCF